MEVIAYDPAWAAHFEALRNRLWPNVGNTVLSIEHVCSTSVPGLAVRPIICLDIVIIARDLLPGVITCLETPGYQHRGDLGIEGRKAFWAPHTGGVAPHHLYVCTGGCAALRNHLILRAYHAEAAAYGALKMQLSERFSHDIDNYMDGKTAFIIPSSTGTISLPRPCRLSQRRTGNEPTYWQAVQDQDGLWH